MQATTMAEGDDGRPVEGTLVALLTRLVLEYAETAPVSRPIELRMSLRQDLAIESLSLVSMTLRIGEELGVDVVDMGLELRSLQTFGDLVKLGRTIEDWKARKV